MKNGLLFTLAFTFCLQMSAVPNKYYVDAFATGANNGANWSNAFNNLQSALVGSTAGDTLWIANGTYKPHASSVTISFQINGLILIGGFAGGESSISQRNVLNNPTILSGDLSGNDVGFTNNSENSYHVIDIVEGGNTVTLDGLIITSGNANGAPGFDRLGGGIALGDGTGTTLQIKNCLFQNNYGANGGALWLYNTTSGNTHTVTIENCLFKNNNVSINGSAIYKAFGINLTTTNCTFVSNTVNALYNYASSGTLSIRNSIFQANTGSPILSSTSAAFTFDHCLFSDDPSANTAINVFTNNLINSDALLISNGELQASSPAIDAGDNAVVTTSLDLKGNTRINHSVVDIGAFEYPQTTAIKEPLTTSGLSCFPNPTEEEIQVKTDVNNERIEAITIYNNLGKEEYTALYNGAENINLNIKELQEGIYFLKVATSTGTTVLKIVKK
jgi:hypothetical protein